MEKINLKKELINILIENQETVTTGQHHDNECEAILSSSYDGIIESFIGLLKEIEEQDTIEFLYSKEEKESFDSVALPLIKWLKVNSHPHSHVIVHQTHAELSEGILVFLDPLSVQETPCYNCRQKFHYQKINERELCEKCDSLIKENNVIANN